MWTNILWVGAGGFAGSVLRYGLGTWIGSVAAGRIPWGTLAVNVIGSFLIGLLMRNLGPNSAGHFLGVVGFCGGFTTFSTFSADTLKLLRAGEWSPALLYVALSLGLCVAATFLGMLVKSTK